MDIFRISIRKKRGQIWPVVVKHEPRGSISPEQYDGELKLPGDFEEQLLETSLDPTAYGTILGEALFSRGMLGTFNRARGSGLGKLRVILNIEDPSLQRLHWQRLCFEQNGEWRSHRP